MVSETVTDPRWCEELQRLIQVYQAVAVRGGRSTGGASAARGHLGFAIRLPTLAFTLWRRCEITRAGRALLAGEAIEEDDGAARRAPAERLERLIVGIVWVDRVKSIRAPWWLPPYTDDMWRGSGDRSAHCGPGGMNSE
jgi:hypothetical protein